MSEKYLASRSKKTQQRLSDSLVFTDFVKSLEIIAREREHEAYDTKQNWIKEEILRQGILTTKLLYNKNSDYGSSFANPPILLPDLESEKALLVRLSDKIERFRNLVSSPENMKVEESLDDTLKDMIGYLILYRVAKEIKKWE